MQRDRKGVIMCWYIINTYNPKNRSGDSWIRSISLNKKEVKKEADKHNKELPWISFYVAKATKTDLNMRFLSRFNWKFLSEGDVNYFAESVRKKYFEYLEHVEM